MRRLVTTLATAVLGIPVFASAAGAGVLTEVAATNFHSRLSSLEPQVAGLTLEVVELGNRLQLTNRSEREVVVLGYEDEPYLRVGKDGVFSNRRSAATYLNADRRGTRTVPEDATADAPPEWTRVSSGVVARWYDHRIHWMGSQDPPTVRAAPNQRHVVVPSWTVPMVHGDDRIEARGQLVWEPGPGLWPWLLLASAPLGVGTLLLGAAVFYRYDAWWARPLAVAVSLLMAAALGLAAGTEHRSPAFLLGAAVAWTAGGAAVALLLRGRRAGLYAAVAAGALVATLAALALGDLTRSQIPWSLPSAWARGLAATCLGLGAVVAVAAGLATQRGSVAENR
ncbi:MAG TPA: hypothetical protein VGV86_01650 [Acidimicrobiales bacterium]|nr:hypothetical protein [Acidimicrobiales bacterium]